MLRVAVVQFAPKLGRVVENIEKAQNLCSRLRPHTVDLVCLPEMIFSGYVFRSAAAIAPFLEHPKTGPTSRFCSGLSARLRCYVVAGYPERLSDAERATRVGSTGNEQGPTAVGANSAVIYGPDGQWVGGYRKTHLYKEDMCWAKPGTGFATFHLPSPLNTLTLGLCMDLNPQTTSWSLEEGPYELAQHCLDTKSNVLLLLNAWLDSAAEIEEDSDWQTLNYWAARLRPLWHSSSDQGLNVANNATSVVICNRAGTEEDVTFAGSSALFSMDKNKGRPVLHEAYGRQDETVQLRHCTRPNRRQQTADERSAPLTNSDVDVVAVERQQASELADASRPG